ncbi:MAG TPA: hypothetical protein VFA65_05005 [Bryobacteraceae bacterium]|nr:hypothetical protein [Bryobacteraceae bacterium]
MTAAAALTFTCPACGFVLVNEPNRSSIQCRRCGSSITIELFPGFYRAAETVQHQPVVSDEASCFFHMDRVAAFTCSRCGRFLCALCRISWAGEDLCPACLQTANSSQKTTQLSSGRFHTDSLALALSTLPLLGGFLSIVTAPVALGFALFTFNRECSIAPRTKIRSILAILFSATTIAIWIVVLVHTFRGRNTSVPATLP